MCAFRELLRKVDLYPHFVCENVCAWCNAICAKISNHLVAPSHVLSYLACLVETLVSHSFCRFYNNLFFPLLPQFWPRECLALHWHDMISAPEIHGNSLCRWATWWRSISSVPMDGGKVKSMARWGKPLLYTIIHLKLKYESSSLEVLVLSCLFR